MQNKATQSKPNEKKKKKKKLCSIVSDFTHKIKLNAAYLYTIQCIVGESNRLSLYSTLNQRTVSLKH